MSIYVFGYGSLINMNNNIELTNFLNKKIYPVIVKGLKRSLNVAGRNHKVFGVKDVKTSLCNGILFKVNNKDLKYLIERESLYTIKNIDKNRINFSYDKHINFNINDKIYCFYPEPKYILNKKNINNLPISKKYLNICKQGSSFIGNNFLQDFISMSIII